MATGEYIGFVDSDDWIEPDMYTAMIDQAEQNDADIVLCGIFDHYRTNVRIIDKTKCNQLTIKTSDEAVQNFILDRSHSLVLWNKIWKKELFSGITFPEGRIFEDASVTWKMVMKANKVVYLPDAYYHYYENTGSLVHTPSLHHLFDHWVSSKERFDILPEKFPSLREACLKECALSIGRTWSYYEQASKNCQVPERYIENLKHMHEFVRKYGKEIIKGSYAIHVKIGIILAYSNTKISRGLAHCINEMANKIKGKKNTLN